MPKKSKGKAPAFCTGEEDMKPFFGLKPRDLVKTPLGLIGTVLGVKYLANGDSDSGILWVEYQGPGGFRSPLEKDLQGYLRCSDADHVWRDLREYQKVMVGNLVTNNPLPS